MATAAERAPSLVGYARRLHAAQGMKAFYRGIKPSLVGALPYNGFDIAVRSGGSSCCSFERVCSFANGRACGLSCAG